jgi:filamentous hemagglutinin family protein
MAPFLETRRCLMNKRSCPMGKRLYLLASLALAATLSIQTSLSAQQVPTAAADGTGTIVTPNSNTFTITGGTTSSSGTNLFHSFNTFGLNTGQVANFQTTSGIQNVLGRVIGGSPSLIDGLIRLTGSSANLFLINPSGILFGSNASLNVPGAFTATTANGVRFGNQWFNASGLNNYALLNGNPNGLAFTTSQPGAVVNLGTLSVGPGQQLSLIGGTVINTGQLSGGQITAAAVTGDRYVRIGSPGSPLSFDLPISGQPLPSNWNLPTYSLSQLLTGTNTNLTVGSDGNVRLGSSQITVPTQIGTTIIAGKIDASTTSAGALGGTVHLFGDRVGLIGAEINASGPGGGGTILVGGDYQGSGIALRANSTFVSSDSSLRADALTSGQGGKITVWSDQVTRFYGSASARGGSQSGNGGVVEVSGKQELGFDGRVDTSAPKGRFGSLLLDPGNINIGNFGNSDSITTTVNFGDPPVGGNLSINASAINDATSNVTLQATNDINFTAPVSITSSGIGLTAQAGNNINVNASITTNAGNVSLIAADPSAGAGNFNLAGGITITAPITTSGGDFKAQGAFINAQGQNIDTSVTSFTGSSAQGGNISLSTTGGNITTGSISSFSSSFGNATSSGNGGAITIISGTSGNGGNITTGSLSSYSSSSSSDDGAISSGKGGAITVISGNAGNGGNITTGSLSSYSSSFTSSFTSSSISGNGGAITVISGNAGNGGNITTGNLLSYSDSSRAIAPSSGNGGAITVISGNAGNGGDISSGDLFSYSSDSGNARNGGAITVISGNAGNGGNISIGNLSSYSSSISGNGGAITVISGTSGNGGNISIGSLLSYSDSSISGNGGAITVISGASGNGGNITTGSLSSYSSSSSSDSSISGNGGAITVISGTSGNGGNITTGNLLSYSSASSSSGNGGAITVISGNAGNGGDITTNGYIDARGAQGGNITLTTQGLISVTGRQFLSVANTSGNYSIATNHIGSNGNIKITYGGQGLFTVGSANSTNGTAADITTTEEQLTNFSGSSYSSPNGTISIQVGFTPTIISDNSLGTIVNYSNGTYGITGGNFAGSNLFQSFSLFNLSDSTQSANFITDSSIQNILARITTGSPSIIQGKIQVTGGTPNLFFLNPAGIVFGTGASLNVPGAFIATTANGVQIGNGFFSATGSSSLLSGTPTALAFSMTQPGAIILGTPLSNFGGSLQLAAGTVISTENLTSPGKPVSIASVGGVSTLNLNDFSSASLGTNQPNSFTLPILSLGNLTTAAGGISGITIIDQNQLQVGNTIVQAGDVALVDVNTSFVDGGGNITISGLNNITIGSLDSSATNQVSASGSNGNITISSTGGNITAGTLRAFGSLVINSTGLTTFSNTVNASSLQTDLVGTTILRGNVTTSGSQTYDDAVQVNAPVVLASTGNGTVSFTSTLDGQLPSGNVSGVSNDLTVNTGTGNVSFGSTVGTQQSLGNLTVNTSALTTFGNTVNASNLQTDLGGTTILRGNVTTSGSQTYGDAVQMNAPVVLASTENGIISFNSTVDGQLPSGNVSGVSNDLTVNTGTGNVSFGSTVGTQQSLGNLSVNTSGSTTFGNTVNASSLQTDSGGTTILGGNVTTSGSQTYGDAVQVNAPVFLTSTGNGILSFNTVQAGVNSLTLTANNLNLNGPASGNGTLTIQPAAPTSSIGIAGAPGTLQVSGNSLNQLQSGFQSITFGGSAQSGNISIGAVTFQDPVIFQTPGGSLFVNGQLNGQGNASFTFIGSGNTTTLNSNILTASQPITIQDSVILGNSVALNTTAGNTTGANITITGNVNAASFGNQGLTLNAGVGNASIGGGVGNNNALASLSLSDTAALSQNAAWRIVGLTTLAVGTSNDITLSNPNNDLNMLAILSGRNVSVTDLNSLTFENATVSGNLAVLAGGSITQAQSSSIFVLGNASFTTTLAQTGNVSVTNNTTTVIGNSVIGGDFTLNSTGNSSQSPGTTLTVAGNLNVTSGGTNTLVNNNTFGNVTLANGDVIINQVGLITLAPTIYSGNVTVNSFASGQQFNGVFGGTAIALNNAANSFGGVLSLNTDNSGFSNVTATPGITQSGALTVPGQATFNATPVGNITLLSPTNSFNSLGFTGNTVSIIQQNGIALVASSASGNLDLQSSNGINQTGALTVGGTSRFTGTTIALGSTTNLLTGAVSLNSTDNATLINNTATLLNASNVNGDLNVTANGNLTQTGVLNVLGTANLDAGANTFTENGGFVGGNLSILASAINLNGSISDNNTTITNNGLLTIASTATLNTTGNFVQNGAGNVNTAGSLSAGSVEFDSPVFLTGTQSITTTNGSVNFASTVDGAQDLTVATGTGNITFNSSVGNSTALGNLIANSTGDTTFGSTVNASSLQTNSGGATFLNGDVTTSGSQTFSDAVQVTAPVVLASTGNGTVSFTSTLDGQLPSGNIPGASNNLTVSTGTGNVNFSGAVGSQQSLGNLTVNTSGLTTFGSTVNASSLQTNLGGATFLNGDVTTAGNQTFGDAVQLASNVTTSASNGAVTFSGTVDGNQSLTVFSGVDAFFVGAVGATNVLTALNVTAPSIRQTSAIQVSGLASFNASNGSIALGNTANQFGSVSFVGDTVTIGQQNPFVLIGTNQVVNLTLSTPQSISLQGTLQVRVNSFFNSGTFFTNNGSFTAGTGTTTINVGGLFTNSGTLALGPSTTTITASDVVLNNNLSGSGDLTLRPAGATSIGINAPGSFNLSQAELNRIVSGFNSVTFGFAGGSGIQFGSVSFNANTYNFLGSGFALGGSLQASGSSLNFGGLVTLNSDLTITAKNFTVGGALDSNGTGRALTIATTGNTALNGPIGTNTALSALSVNADNIAIANIGTNSSAGVTGNTALTAINKLTFTGSTYNANTQTYTSNSPNTIVIAGGSLATFTASQDPVRFQGNILLQGGGLRVVGASTLTTGNISGSGPVTLTASNALSTGNIATNGGAIALSGDTVAIGSINSSSATGGAPILITTNSNPFVVQTTDSQALNASTGLITSNSSNILRSGVYNGPFIQGDIQIINPGVSTSTANCTLVGTCVNPVPLPNKIDRTTPATPTNLGNYEFDALFKAPLLSLTEVEDSLRRLQKATGKRLAIISVDSKSNLLTLITPDSSTIVTIPLSVTSDVLRTRAADLRRELADPSNTLSNRYLVLSQQLYSWLIAPLEADLQSRKIDTLIFQLDSGLRLTPLAALNDGKQFLIEKFNLSLIPSINLLNTEYTPERVKQSQVLAMGSSNFADDVPLPAVPIELTTVVKEAGGSVFLNQQFTLDNLKSQSIRYGIVHLATHADFNKGTFQNSYIKLNNTRLGLDQMRELGWSRQNIELLVLSACRTAFGDNNIELGFAGLSIQAGVKTAVATLWRSSDLGTFGLMTEFYGKLKNVAIKADALRGAQIAMLSGKVRVVDGQLRSEYQTISLPADLKALGDISLTHPYYWAGFTMIGSPW